MICKNGYVFISQYVHLELENKFCVGCIEAQAKPKKLQECWVTLRVYVPQTPLHSTGGEIRT